MGHPEQPKQLKYTLRHQPGRSRRREETKCARKPQGRSRKAPHSVRTREEYDRYEVQAAADRFGEIKQT